MRKALYLPIRKYQRVTTESGQEALICEGTCSICNVVDSQSDVMTVPALKAAMEEWSRYSNVRMSHDPSLPVGTCKMPIGRWNKAIEPPGWRMDTDPETGMPCAILRIYVTDSQAIAKIKGGILRGLSVAGEVLSYREGIAEVDDAGRVLSFEGRAL